MTASWGNSSGKCCSLTRGTHTAPGSAKRKHWVDAQATTVIYFGTRQSCPR